MSDTFTARLAMPVTVTLGGGSESAAAEFGHAGAFEQADPQQIRSAEEAERSGRPRIDARLHGVERTDADPLCEQPHVHLPEVDRCRLARRRRATREALVD